MVDQFSPAIDVVVFAWRDPVAARWFFTRALAAAPPPVEASANRAASPRGFSTNYGRPPGTLPSGTRTL